MARSVGTILGADTLKSVENHIRDTEASQSQDII